MGTGDWNDGMNRVGEAGQGESVWLGWFLHATLTRLRPDRRSRATSRRGPKPGRRMPRRCARALEREGWDGDWYRRAYFDDGTPLGSAASDECRIDSIAQSWAVLSGAGDPARAAQAMAAVDEHLVRRGDRLALLFTPPFDKTALDPGYIKGYPPGVRENGGQYTHAAVWAVMAFAALGDGDKAAELFSLLNPINHAQHARRRAALQGRAVRRGRRRLLRAAARRARRLDLVHGLGRLDVPRRHRVDPGPPASKAESLVIDPCIPAAWPGFEMTLRYRGAVYEISVRNPDGVSRGVIAAQLDGEPQPISLGSARLQLAADQGAHMIVVTMGRAVAA